jgi:hypothetical protein
MEMQLHHEGAKSAKFTKAFVIFGDLRGFVVKAKSQRALPCADWVAGSSPTMTT